MAVYIIVSLALGLPVGFGVGWLMGWHEHQQRHDADVIEIDRLRHTIRTLQAEPPASEGHGAPGTSGDAPE